MWLLLHAAVYVINLIFLSLFLKGVHCREIYQQDLPQDLQSQWPIRVLLVEAFFSNDFNIFRSNSLKGSVCWSWPGIFYSSFMCWKSSLEMFFLPPHRKHALQPFDRTLFKPIKTHYHQETTNLMVNNSDAAIT